MHRWAGWVVVGVGVGGLACAGLGGGDAATEGDAVTDGVDPLATEPLPPGTFAVWWLDNVDGSCVWYEQLLGPIAVDEQLLAKLPGACPANWRIGPPAAGGDRVVVYGDDGGFVLGQGKIVPFRPIVDRFPLVTVAGGEVLACGDVEGAEVETGSDTHYAWKLDGKDYALDSESPTGAVLVRTWKLGDEGWVERSVSPMETYEGMTAPWCDGVEDFPKGATEVRPDVDPLSDGSGWREPTESEAPALTAISEGQWSVLESGKLAARTEWFEGLLFGRPVVLRKGDAWETVLAADESGATFALHDTWMLVNGPSGATLVDLNTGDKPFTAPAKGVFAPGLEVLPPLPPLDTVPAALPPAPAPAPDAAPAPAPEPRAPAHTKIKAKAKAKHKAKVP